MDNFADDRVKLNDIARNIEEVEAMAAGLRFETFTKETQVKNEIVYLLREIGIGTRLLSEEFKANFGHVDWDVFNSLQFATWDQEIEIDPHSLWYIIENDIPKLHDEIDNINSELQNKNDNEQFFF